MVRALGASALAALIALTTACGTTSLPAGVYTNQQYHFKVSYPTGWQTNVSSQPDATAPLILIITRSGEHPTAGAAVISSLTIDVLALSDVGGSAVAANLAKDKTLIPATISGLPGYQDHPTRQQGTGNTSTDVVTHTDFYLVHGAYEYQISIDALAGDDAALASMESSFTII